MGACRESFSLWLRIKFLVRGGPLVGGKVLPYSSRRKEFRRFRKYLWRVVRLDPWARRYFWHDTFGKYWNRFLACPVLGHRDIQWLEDGGCGDPKAKWYCFGCEQEVDPPKLDKPPSA
jgi:hypothetical protein